MNGINNDGRHLRPPGRNLPQRRGLQVTEDGHGHRARDRRRGHHQDMWPRVRLGAQCGALLHSEPMLLVDHNEAEVGELHIGAEQGVSADDDPSLARGRLKRCLPTAPRRGGSGDQHDAGRVLRRAKSAATGQLAEHPGDRLEVLSRQHLGRRQQRGLTAGVDHRQHCAQRDERLA